MKKLFTIALILALFAVPAMAEDYEMSFAWEQATADLPNLDRWKLYMSGIGIGTQSVDIVYTSGAGPTFTSDQVLTVEVLPGESVVRNFVLAAISKNGNETLVSNQADHTFRVAYSDVTTPQNFRITGVVVVP